MTALIGLKDNLAMARLMVITDLRGGTEAFVDFLDQMFRAGADILQVRAPEADDAALREALDAAVQPTFDHRKLLCVGRNTEVAAGFTADLLHLGSTDGDLGDARARLGKWSLVGRSVHDRAQLDHAVLEKADWITVGPVYGNEVPGPDLVREAAEVLPVHDEKTVPWFAVGGITLDNLDEVLAAGAVRVAVSSAITTAEDPAAAAAEFSTRVRTHWKQRPDMADYVFRAMGGPGRSASLNPGASLNPDTVAGPPNGAGAADEGAR
ncbi:thiamine phosphate synthase [Propionibacteriaceae bacterium Y1923]|uniref:thiamine phosphate synthase n=1 Tax=Aestuariimicrobium sp. Y1814 TaxID=3418742 RepID=UPI003C15C535